MKKLLSTVLISAIVAACLCGCSKTSSLTLEKYGQPLSIHTADQISFIESDDVSVIGVFADGKAEKSRPQPIELKWSDGKSYESYTVEISEKPDFSVCEAYTAKTCSVSVYNLKIATDYYWRVRTDTDCSAAGTFSTEEYGPRTLYVDGVTNVRDLGGWKTADGGRVAQGLIFRGGRLNKSDVNDDGYATPPTTFVPEITEEGARVFTETLGIKTEIDFRLLTRNGYPADKELESTVAGVNYVSIPMNGNASIIDSEVNVLALKQFMELLADKTVYPVYIHCNIGTDRTGLVAYLLNALCGVEKTDLLRDYLFSNFGDIGEAKTPSNSKNKYVELLDDKTLYPGSSLAERVESFFRSINVSEETYAAVRKIMLGRESV